MNSLGWSRREEQANTSQQNPILGTLSKLNPFGSEGYVRLPTTEGEGPGAPLPARTRREEEEGWFARKSLTIIPPHTTVLAPAATLSLFLDHVRIMHTNIVGAHEQRTAQRIAAAFCLGHAKHCLLHQPAASSRGRDRVEFLPSHSDVHAPCRL